MKGNAQLVFKVKATSIQDGYDCGCPHIKIKGVGEADVSGLSNATRFESGLMSKNDKIKLDSLTKIPKEYVYDTVEQLKPSIIESISDTCSERINIIEKEVDRLSSDSTKIDALRSEILDKISTTENSLNQSIERVETKVNTNSGNIQKNASGAQENKANITSIKAEVKTLAESIAELNGYNATLEAIING